MVGLGEVWGNLVEGISGDVGIRGEQQIYVVGKAAVRDKKNPLRQQRTLTKLLFVDVPLPSAAHAER